jgi:hypothetical protein
VVGCLLATWNVEFTEDIEAMLRLAAETGVQTGELEWQACDNVYPFGVIFDAVFGLNDPGGKRGLVRIYLPPGRYKITTTTCLTNREDDPDFCIHEFQLIEPLKK